MPPKSGFSTQMRMDYNKISTANIDGNGNLVLQDVEGQNITINYNDTKEFAKLLSLAGDKLTNEIKQLMSNTDAQNKAFADTLSRFLELPPEIKTFKEKLRTSLRELHQKAESVKNTGKLTDTAENPASRSRRGSSILRALQEEKCILFLGPEISTDANRNSLHDQFYLSLTDDPESDLEYNPEEGFFQPHNDPWFNSDIQNYYAEAFPKENQTGNKIITALAALPFKLIISMAPDDSVHRIFSQYDLEHEFIFYDKVKLPEVKPTKEKPVIFNMLGSPVHCESDRPYIFTYADLYDYLQSVQIPGSIKSEIRNAVHYLFLGFDFNKWYNRLILYVLNLIEGKESKIRQLIEPESIDARNLDFLKKQFNISAVENDYLRFTEELTTQAREANIAANLETAFAEKQLTVLEHITAELFDAEKMTELKEIEEKLTLTRQKLESHGY